MKAIMPKASEAEVVLKWRIQDQLNQEMEALSGEELFDVHVYGEHIDITVWNKTKDIERERELRALLPERLFDTWTERKWRRMLMEWNGEFAYKTKGARALEGKAYEVMVTLYGVDPLGCKVTKVTKTMEVYESDCKDAEISEDKDNEI